MKRACRLITSCSLIALLVGPVSVLLPHSLIASAHAAGGGNGGGNGGGKGGGKN